MSLQNVDAIVVGGGIIGLTAALGLAKLNYSVALIDKQAAPAQTLSEEFSARVSAISLASQKLFEDLGIWQNICRLQAYTHMEVWDKDGFGKIDFCAEPLGHIIENDAINIALYKALASLSNVSMFFEHSVSDMSANAHCASLSLSPNSQNKAESKTLQAKILIGADGANSRVREHFGFKHTFWDYDHTAIVANVRTELEHNKTARQAFTPHGPLAFLPLSDPHHSSIVFSQTNASALQLMALGKQDFEKTLQASIDNHYGKCTLQNKRISFPLRMRYARQWTGQRITLVGDAAHTIHPLAGQGANLGLGDVLALLNLAKANPDKLGETSQLRQYERCRKSEAVKVIATMQGFKTLFDGNNPAKKLLRNTGLAGANHLPKVKEFFIQQAMGA